MLRGLVADDFWLHTIENLVQAVFIGDIDTKETRLRVQVRVLSTALFPQVVYHSDPVSCRDTLIDDMRANETRSTSH